MTGKHKDMEPKVRETSVLKQIADWSTPLLCLCFVACLQVGCATVHTRFGCASNKPKPVFPSTRYAAETVPDWFNKDRPQAGGLGAAIILGTGVFAYALVELLPAMVSDIVLFPLDAYFVSKRSAIRRREKERCLEGSKERQGNIWNTDDGSVQWLLEGHTNWVVSLGFSDDMKYFASGGGDSTARVYSLQTGKEIGRVRFPGSSTYVESVDISSDGRYVLAAVDEFVGIYEMPK